MAPYASTSSSTRYRSHVCQPQFQWNSTGGRRKLFVSRVPSLFINVSPVTLLCCHLRSSWGTFTGILVLSLTGMIPPALGSSASASAHTPWPLSSPKLLVVQGQVQAPPQYLPDLRLTLNGGLLSVAPSASGTFEIGPLRPGSYLLQPSHPLLHLSSYLVKVPTSSSEAPQVFALGDSFRPVVKLSLPLVIAPLGLSPPLYFAIKPPFSLLVLLQQPLLLVAIACCALMWCLPRLQQYQEEDERQQRAALLQHQDLLARHNLPNDHHTNNQERYGDGGRITPAATSWRGDERGRYRADVDDGVEAEEVQSEDYIDHSAFSKCLASMRPPGGSQSFCIR